MNGLEIFSLAEKTVLVTGATGYLGESMVWALAGSGANVLVNSRSFERCEAVVVALQAQGLNAESAAFDVTDSQAISEFFGQRQNLVLSCLINNAYSGGAGTVETSDADSYRGSYEMSVVSAHNLLTGALPALRLAVRKHGDASVINIASMYGLVSPDLRVYAGAASSNPPFYGAAKAALVQWTRYAACEFGHEGIRVNSISPGPFPSRAVQQTAPEFVAKLAKKVPLGRVGQANEIQGALILLASQASSFINGANISIDGGWTSW